MTIKRTLIAPGLPIIACQFSRPKKTNPPVDSAQTIQHIHPSTAFTLPLIRNNPPSVAQRR